jgi:hypothetical protein
MRSILELDCARVRKFQEIAAWAIEAFELPISIDDLPTFPVRGLLFTKQQPSMDALTNRIYRHVGENRLAYTVMLRNYSSASSELLTVLDHPSGWRQAFGSGLPHDYGTFIEFESPGL